LRGDRADGLGQVAARINIDAMIALATAVERADQRPAPVEILGWLLRGRGQRVL
jgi:hypothetical protein